MIRIKYPKHNSKVSNQEVHFRWKSDSGAARYKIAVWSLRSSGRIFEWLPVFSATVTDPEFHRYLPGGKFYFCCVYAVGAVAGIESGLQIVQPRPDIPPDFHRVPPPPVPDEHRESINYAESYFYVKKKENYLKKYFQIKAEQKLKPQYYLKPAVPLLFALLERYVKSIGNPDEINSTDLDQKFSEIIEAQPGRFRSREKLANLVKGYQNLNLKELKEEIFGPGYSEAPSETDFEEWSQNCLNAMFGDSWLTELRNPEIARKTMDLEFKHSKPLVARGIDLAEELKIPVDKDIVGNDSDQLNPAFFYSLRLFAFDRSELARIDLRLMSDENGNYFLYSPTTEMHSYCSAFYKAELWAIVPNSEDYIKWGYEGRLTIHGGIPIVLSVEPPSAPEDYTEIIKVKIRDGGEGKQIILKDTNGGYRIPQSESPRLNLIEQSLKSQTFIFRLSDAGPEPPDPGVYDLYFINSDEKSSLNSIKFQVKGYEYRVWIQKIKCIDESNPEWWGNDTISFETFISTQNFLQDPTSSRNYGGFHSNFAKSNFQNKDNFVYPYATRPNGRRIIEDYLAISIAIYEHDDLGWLAWLIDSIIDLVQSFLAHMVNAFTFGLGGYLIEAGLELSGVNDMREQAIDTMVASWEVEILHEGKVQITPPAEDTLPHPLRMKTNESEYQVNFVIDRQIES
ncbi:MAG: hypothetical protein KJP06_01100 [Deltaproteobacteria bacterium]|nr:hypothetical protein [Deltaproteobacteria bacterium]